MKLNAEQARAPRDKSQKIFFVRHAKPELPHEGKLYYGHTDYPLSEIGVARARQLGNELRDVAFDRIYCSDLTRARQTAELILEGRDSKLNVTPSLREIFLGDWEGKSFDEVRTTWEELYEKRGASFDSVPPPGGESFLDLQRRSVPAFASILEESPSGNILVVAHAAFIWSVMCHYFSFKLNDLFFYPLDFCGMHLLYNANGLLRLMRYNWNSELLEGKFW
ncbi:histidine phosphatase family protein [Synergistaceae bacterium OttesenSCG-928-D05]|nr:histidine phosphatase family protein [Synergistaceae bacterium OttesenSCG-928-D05]